MSDPTPRPTPDPTANLPRGTAGATAPTTTHTPGPSDPTIGGLVHQLTEQIPQLIRSEMKLAQAEMAEKGKRAGVGVGLFSAAGLLALYGLGFLLAALALLLALALPTWAAVLIVSVVLFVAAGIAGLVGKKNVSQATPAKPERTLDNVNQDIATLKGEQS